MRQVPTKSYFLEKWFAIGDKLSALKMDLFKKNNIPYLELKMLPAADKAMWDLLQRKSDKVTKNICKIINGK